jgi:biopolymer transport protein TolR
MKVSGNTTPLGSLLSSHSTLAEINVTPLVDVMLVLLIVFMVSAPLMQQGVQVDLPHANAGNLTQAPDPILLTLQKNRSFHIGDRAFTADQLRQHLETLVSKRSQVEVILQADQALPYGVVAETMAEIKRAGIHRVGLATTQSAPRGPASKKR